MFLLGLNGVLVHYNHPKSYLHSPRGLQPGQWCFVINTTDLISASYSCVDMCSKISVQDSFFFAGLHKETRVCLFLSWDVCKGTWHSSFTLSGFGAGELCDDQFLVGKGSCIYFLMNSWQILIGTCHHNSSGRKLQKQVFFCNLAGLHLLRKPQQASNPCQQ